MAGSTPKRPLAYRLGQLLAVGEVAARREHDPALIRLAYTNPAMMIATVTPAVIMAKGWQERRWQNVMAVIDAAEVTNDKLSDSDQSLCALGYWHERALFNRANRMTAMRKKLGMTQADWAQALGVSFQTVQSWEGHRNNVPEEMEKMAELVKERTIN